MTKNPNHPIECSSDCKWFQSKHSNCRIDEALSEHDDYNLESMNEQITILAEAHRNLF